ncbi:MAG: DUF3857 domain-containing protein [candidate division Zixibacteria bacterium]|nr:DUF3857 domain-containing protein [candidate division Zixibacteria bacterium]
MKWIPVYVLLICQFAMADHQFNWKQPPPELLQQTVCPMDSTADAMVAQKETEFEVVYERGGSVYLQVKFKKRIKIYTESGLSYAEYKEYYDRNKDIKSIKAFCYTPSGEKIKLSKNEIYEELVIKDKQKNIKVKSKSFAMPGVTPGCVIDIFIESIHENLLFPPVYRFHEDIPVQYANFRLILPQYFEYAYVINNETLINIEKHQEQLTMVGSTKGKLLFICEGSGIAAIEDESLRPPKRNLVTDIYVALTLFNNGYFKKEFADSWESLIKHYTESFKKSLKKSKKARKVADSLKYDGAGEDDLIKLAYDYTRDRWANSGAWGIGGPSDKVDKMMKWESLDAENKSTILCAILKHLGIESEVVWVCSDDADYSPINFPSLRMFDYALVYIPSKSLYLDPADPGGQVGILDAALSNRFICLPFGNGQLLGYTPEFEKISGSVVNLRLKLTDDNGLQGDGDIIYYNQAAIEARRDFMTLSESEKNEAIGSSLFDDDDESVDSVVVAPDSLQKPDEFKVDFQVSIPDLIEDDTYDYELKIYPGPTFTNSSIDNNPPRKYPVYFGTNRLRVYNIEWDLGSSYKPINPDSLRFKEKKGQLSYSLMTQYDEVSNKLSVRRYYNRSNSFFKAEFSAVLEELWQKGLKHDLSTVILEKQ